MPDLSPEAACALSDFMECLAYEIDFHYANEIRNLQQMRDREAAEMNEIEEQIEFQTGQEFNDKIPF